MSVPKLAVISDRLDVDSLTAAIVATAGPVGAVATFLGVVRDRNQGRTVHYLVYEAYEPLALRSFERIAAEIGREWPSVALGLHHRTGRLDVGEASVAIVAASPHRGEAFAACRYAIERVKQIAPIWKHEHFDGGDVWIEGSTAEPDDERAREEARRRACA
jgi:molybdopterin synthase catalytic subunit